VHSHPTFAADNRLVRRLQSSAALIMCTPLHGPVQFAVRRGLGLVGLICYSKIVHSPSGSLPHVTHCFSGHAHWFSKTVPMCKPPNLPLPLEFRTLPEEDGATAIGNMHKNLAKIVHVIPEISSWTDKQTDTQTHRCAHHNTSQPLPRAK